MMKKILISLVAVCVLISCEEAETKISASDEKAASPAEVVLADALMAHGGDRYDKAHYEFTFREKLYRFQNSGEHYQYKVRYSKNDTLFEDFLSNEGFSRKVNGVSMELSSKQETDGRNSINSVIYFATLPHKLNDPAVNMKYIGTKKIKVEDYDVLHITFDQEGGGDDHDDNYYYWINRKSKLIDFLAYDYTVNKGGVRFRTAHNKRWVDDIVFQDYVNFKAPVGTALADLPRLWEDGKLEKLSDINTERVKSLSSRE